MRICAVIVMAFVGGIGLGGCGDRHLDRDHDGWWHLGDCNDADAGVHPDAEEVCNGVDDDCDFEIDEGVVPQWYPDVDGDGYGDDGGEVSRCTGPASFVEAGGDCDDTDPKVQPGAEELCNGVDDDCDDEVDEDVVPKWYPDADGDGYGDERNAVTQCECPAGYVDDDDDCDDTDPEVHPAAEERCNGIDDDCTGDGISLEVDNDRDGLSECLGDCNDTTADAYPGAQEICDGLDDDCDGVLPPDEIDADMDGDVACADCNDADRTAAHGHFEVCDSVDNNCDGTVDEACNSCDLAIPNNYATVQEGIDGAAPGNVVCVGPGTWYEQINFRGAEITLLGVAGRDATLLDGDGVMGPVVIFESGETAATKMQGFTVQNGWSEDDRPGGIEILGASPTLSDLIVAENDAWDAYAGCGGGISMSDGQPSMTRLIVSGNEAVYGGGLCLLSSQATLEDLVIVDNWAFYGGGVYLADAEATFERVVINQNYSGDDDDGAGGAYFLSSVATLTNVVVTDNQSSGVAGGIELDDSSATLTNVDVSGNTSDWAGGIYSHSSSVTLSNVDIVDNWGWGHGGGVWGYFTISHSNLNGNYPDDVYGMADPIGTNGNISADPDLYDSLGHLNTTSPLVDAGDPAILDPDGSPSDIGAFGGPGADDWDLDGDGYFSWWLPGAYDPATSPGMDCNDEDATVYPGAGC